MMQSDAKDTKDAKSARGPASSPASSQAATCVVCYKTKLQETTLAHVPVASMHRTNRSTTFNGQYIYCLSIKDPKNVYENTVASRVMGHIVIGDAILCSDRGVSQAEIEEFDSVHPAKQSWATLARKLPSVLRAPPRAPPVHSAAAAAARYKDPDNALDDELEYSQEYAHDDGPVDEPVWQEYSDCE